MATFIEAFFFFKLSFTYNNTYTSWESPGDCHKTKLEQQEQELEQRRTRKVQQGFEEINVRCDRFYTSCYRRRRTCLSGFQQTNYRQIVGIPMGTNCAPLIADLFLFCYERDFMTSLSGVKQAEIIEAFKSTSRYLDDLLNIDNPYFDGMVNRIYQPELQLNKANTADTEAPFFDLHLSISNGFVSSKIYDKRDDFDFDIVNFPFLDGDVPRSTSYGVYISQLI